MDEQAPPPAWRVTGQQETMDLSAGGTYVAGVKVSFQTTRGTLGSVFVPSDQYAPERVRQLVAERAAAIDAVDGLTG